MINYIMNLTQHELQIFLTVCSLVVVGLIFAFVFTTVMESTFYKQTNLSHVLYFFILIIIAAQFFDLALGGLVALIIFLHSTPNARNHNSLLIVSGFFFSLLLTLMPISITQDLISKESTKILSPLDSDLYFTAHTLCPKLNPLNPQACLGKVQCSYRSIKDCVLTIKENLPVIKSSLAGGTHEVSLDQLGL